MVGSMRTTFASQGGEWMLRQQELIVKEARQQLAHPATVEARGRMSVEKIARAGTPGSMLRIGLNPDPMKNKMRARQAEMSIRGAQGPTTCQSQSALAAATAGDQWKLARSSSAPSIPGEEKERQLSSPLGGKSFQTSIKGTSSAMHFLNQLNGFVQSPYGVGGGMGGASRHALEKSQSDGFGTRDLLYCGVSKECEGRHAYLRLRKKQDLKTRFGTNRSITSNGEVGWRLAEQKATEKYAPTHVGTARGTLMRTLAADAPLLMKTNSIVDERIKMERILGIKTRGVDEK